MSEKDPYDEGWDAGYNDILTENPYEEGTDSWSSYNEGLIDGIRNS